MSPADNQQLQPGTLSEWLNVWIDRRTEPRVPAAHHTALSFSRCTHGSDGFRGKRATTARGPARRGHPRQEPQVGQGRARQHSSHRDRSLFSLNKCIPKRPAGSREWAVAVRTAWLSPAEADRPGNAAASTEAPHSGAAGSVAAPRGEGHSHKQPQGTPTNDRARERTPRRADCARTAAEKPAGSRTRADSGAVAVTGRDGRRADRGAQNEVVRGQGAAAWGTQAPPLAPTPRLDH